MILLALAKFSQGMWYARYRDRVEDCLAVHTIESIVGVNRCDFFTFANNEVM